MKLPLPAAQLKKILIAENLTTSDAFDGFFAEAERKNQSVMDVLVAEKVIEEKFMAELVAKALGVEVTDFSTATLNKEIVRLLPEDVSRQRQAVVFSREANGTYDVAMADPSDLATIEFISQKLKGRIKPFLATSEDLNRGFSVYGYELGQDFKKIIEENVRASLAGHAKNAEEAAVELPIVGIADNILSYAIASRASDIHIEILEDATLVRYRVDGILYEIMSIPKTIHAAIVARIKILAGLKIDEHTKPQDGRFRHSLINQIIDVRVAVMPTYYGEKVEMRLLESSEKPLSLEELGMNARHVKTVKDALQGAYGMILSCGPTGSGKTTTLYALMNILNRPEVNITTIEDPIEYNMKYINQTQINPQSGVTFASGLRALLRQDPNIVMVGEIRDAETAGISVQAALTGHLLMSSLHTNDAPTVIPRLFDLQVPPFLLSSVLNLAIAQRLVRKICQSCTYSYDYGPELAKAIADQLHLLGIDAASSKAPKILYRGKGCSVCGMTGYRGRIGIFEILEVTDKIRKVIVDPRFDYVVLKTEARAEGMRTMFEDGLEKVELALTTIEEVMRVIRD